MPIVLATALTACIEDVGKDKAAAEIQETQNEPTDTEATAPGNDQKATVLQVDPARSSLTALGAKVTAKQEIQFPEFTGTMEKLGDDISQLSFTVTMASLTTDKDKLTSHLMNADFFDVGLHPTSTFTSSSVKAGSNVSGFSHTVVGQLNIRGISRKIAFPATIEVKEKEVSAQTEFTINRQDFGISYPGRADDLIQDNVVLAISFVAPVVP